MRNFKSFALLAALALTTVAFAEVKSSTSTGFSTATNEMEATGTYASIVSFTLPTASMTIPSKQVRPGASFTITIPVTNTTDRPITVTPDAVDVGTATNITVSQPAAQTIAQGAEVSFIYTVTFEDDSAAGSALVGDVTLKFPMAGEDTAEAVTPLNAKDF